MTTAYPYSLLPDHNDYLFIKFEPIHQNTEFLKELLQILGMYNFILKDQQNIWKEHQLCAILSAPNGLIKLRIDASKTVSLIGETNQKDILQIDAILKRFSVFKKVEIAVVAEFA
ncbi:hypothetical protein [Maribacter sp. 2308TA10-17]|uniref:hypothetical protein n=1 Tax=Maribacter sp. 2308TA10-17 TaxID=3386276 RepID=UPI0039BCB024